ncbi:MAG: hypothetical protein ABR915_18265 [Thermoguttaceae bacterium]|jgi:50S ribosomal subunit-associated GTPase HflX
MNAKLKTLPIKVQVQRMSAVVAAIQDLLSDIIYQANTMDVLNKLDKLQSIPRDIESLADRIEGVELSCNELRNLYRRQTELQKSGLPREVSPRNLPQPKRRLAPIKKTTSMAPKKRRKKHGK